MAWAALLEQGDPSLALANTVEVQSLSGRTIGLIVLPSHPLRMAWHVAYDNLVFHAAFEQSVVPKQIREEFQGIDGAMFPAFLPGLKDGSTFVFADTLGFHALGMVPDDDKEPKASLAILTRTLGESEVGDTAPTAGKQSPTVLETSSSNTLSVTIRPTCFMFTPFDRVTDSRWRALLAVLGTAIRRTRKRKAWSRMVIARRRRSFWSFIRRTHSVVCQTFHSRSAREATPGCRVCWILATNGCWSH